MKKRLPISIAMIASASLLLSACTSAADQPETNSADAEFTVWYADILDGNPLMTAVTQSLNATLAENGVAMTRSLAIEPSTGQIDIALQAQALQRAVDSGPDAIAYFLFDPTLAEPQLTQAMAAGIPVFAAFGQPEFDVNAYLTIDDEQAGYVAAKYLADNLPSGAQVTIMSGQPTPNVQALEAGALRAFEESDVTIVGDLEQQRNLDDNSAGANAVMQGILQKFPDIQGVFTYNDNSAVGAIAAAKQAGAKVKFTSRNGEAEGVAAVKAGDLLATCDILPVQAGKALAEAIIAHLRGDHTYTNSERIDAVKPEDCLVTADNADEWQSPEDQLDYVEIPLG